MFILELLGGEIPPKILRFPLNAETCDKLYLKYKFHPPNLLIHPPILVSWNEH